MSTYRVMEEKHHDKAELHRQMNMIQEKRAEAA